MAQNFCLKAQDMALPLPIHPRSTGINFFNRDDQENWPGGNFVEICWVASGKCNFELNNVWYSVSAGECIYRLPGEVRRKRALSDQTCIYWATFDGHNAKDFMTSFNYPRHPMPGGTCPVQLFDRIARGLVSDQPEIRRQLVAVLVELITRMTGGYQQITKSNLTEEALYLCNTQCGDPNFNINILTDELNIHRSTLGRMIKASTGMSPIEYLMHCRLELALEYLRSTTLSVEEITHKIGLRQSNYFCRKIREITGQTPLQYRKAENLRLKFDKKI